MLEGIRVVEIGQAYSAPHGAEILGFLGAEVIKIERPAGDDTRTWGEPVHEGSSFHYHMVNRNKESVVLDLSQSDDLESFFKLIETADVFLHNMRPGVAEKLGVGAETLRKRFPKLIYGELGAFGHTGPLKMAPGYEILMQAFSGIMSITGLEGAVPVRSGPSICDFGSGMWLAIGTLAALIQRSQTGEGCTINTSIFETALSWIGNTSGEYLYFGKEPPRVGNSHPAIAPYGLYPTSDGSIIIGTANDRLFDRFAKAVNREEWLENPNYNNNVNRVRYRKVLEGKVAEVLMENTSQHWHDIFTEVGIPCAIVQTIPEALDHPQTQALGIVQTAEDAPNLRTIGLPLSFDGERLKIKHAAPKLGNDTKAILE